MISGYGARRAGPARLAAWRAVPQDQASDAAILCAARRRSIKGMARRVGIAPTSSGFGGLRIACLPPPYVEILNRMAAGRRWRKLRGQRPRAAIHGVTRTGWRHLYGCAPCRPCASRMKRTNTAATHGMKRLLHRWRRTRRWFHGGCFGVYGTPPGKPLDAVKLGTSIPSIPASMPRNTYLFKVG